MTRKALSLAAALAAAVTVVTAQQKFDRSQIPPAGPAPELRVPAWTHTTLANGAELIVSEKHDLPLISFSITFMGGADQFDAMNKIGETSLMASMLEEGTTTKTGEQISNALQMLGTDVTAAVRDERGVVGFTSTTRNFEPTLAILADMLVNPTFPPEALERQRAQELVALEQAKSRPSAIAARVFPLVLYGDKHPYGPSPTDATVKAIARDDLVALHKQYFRPNHALITVVGDVSSAGAKAIVQRGLAAWGQPGAKVTFDYPAVPPPQKTTIYLVDKPGAAQSTFAIGLPGPPRSTSDYYAIEVMNTMLGGYFRSRLNLNLREEKGYSYGVRSSFDFGKGPGPFEAGGDIVSAKTDAALLEFMKELKGIQGERPVTDEELKTAKDALVQRLPSMFASVAGVNNAITTLWLDGLPDDYYQHYGDNISAVSKDDVLRVAKQYIDLDHLAIVIVGDRASIEGPLKATNVAPIVLLDADGRRVGTM
jgi:predicted Zn-dependent peptidase